MFLLSEIEHTLRVPPHLLSRPLDEAIKGELDSLLDKIIENLGLCISVHDIHSIVGGFIPTGEGASTYKVRFRLVMFRPFVGEVIFVRLKEYNKNGLRWMISGGYGSMGGILPLTWTVEVRFRVHRESFLPIPVDEVTKSGKNELKVMKPFAPMVITGSLDGDGLDLISWWV